MKRYSAFLLLLLSFCLAFTGCFNEDESSSKDNFFASPNVKIEIKEKTDETKLAAILPDSEFKDPSYLVNISLSSDSRLENVSLVKISLDAEDENITFKEEEVIAALPVLEKGKEVIIKTSFPGDTPVRAITYENERGEKKKFALSLSGFDGKLITEEF